MTAGQFQIRDTRPMLRFTIRDVLWLMVVVSILALWAVERQWMSHDWASIHRRDGQLLDRIDKQAAAMKSQAEANTYLYSTLQSERARLREWEQKLAELESARQPTLVEAEPNP
jgi:hypothetical protein